MSVSPDAVLALAALAQACDGVYQLATTGEYSQDDEIPLVNSLFIFEADTTLEIYGGNAQALKPGLEILSALAAGNHNRKQSAEVIKYGFSLLHLEKKLARQGDMLQIIRSRLEHINLKMEHFSQESHSPYDHAAISALYKDTLSTFNYRIQINGKAEYLQQSAIADRIRSLLFSGVRSAMLWRQLGGNHWKLFFQRKQVLQQTRNWQAGK